MKNRTFKSEISNDNDDYNNNNDNNATSSNNNRRGKRGKKADHEQSTAGIPVIILFPEIPRSWRKTHLHRTVTGLGHHGVLPE